MIAAASTTSNEKAPLAGALSFGAVAGGVDENPRQGSTSEPQASAGRRRAATAVPSGARDEARSAEHFPPQKLNAAYDVSGFLTTYFSARSLDVLFKASYRNRCGTLSMPELEIFGQSSCRSDPNGDGFRFLSL